jgi:hypothetical protein
MNILSGKDLVETWEAGQNRPLWFKAMLVLARAFPGMKKKQLADMSIGKRNYYLLKLRQLMFGSTIESCANCPQCGESLELRMNAEDLLGLAPRETGAEEFSINMDGVDLEFRTLNSRDMAALDECSDSHSARLILLERCLLNVLQKGKKLELKLLPQTIIFNLGEKMAETYDPHVEIKFSMECPACKHNWKAFFDIVSFLWAEIHARAQRVLHEVHLLAGAYGWQQADILDMSAPRKQFYLELVS